MKAKEANLASANQSCETPALETKLKEDIASSPAATWSEDRLRRLANHRQDNEHRAQLFAVLFLPAHVVQKQKQKKTLFLQERSASGM